MRAVIAALLLGACGSVPAVSRCPAERSDYVCGQSPATCSYYVTCCGQSVQAYRCDCGGCSLLDDPRCLGSCPGDTDAG